MKARTPTAAPIRDTLAATYRERARGYYPGTVGLSAEDCDGLVDELVGLGPRLDLDKVDDLGDLDPAGWLRKAVRLLAGAPCTVAGWELVGIVHAHPGHLSGQVWTVNPDGTITPADLSGNEPRPSRRVSTSSRDGTVSAAPGDMGPPGRAAHPSATGRQGRKGPALPPDEA